MAFALLYGAGATLVLATLLFHSSESYWLPGVIGPPVVAYGVAALCIARGDRLPFWLFRLLPPFGALLISLIAYSSDAGAFNAYALLYVWVIVSAFYFFTWWEGVPSLVAVAAGYAIVLTHHDSADDRALFWVMGVGTLAVASLLLALVRRRIERLVAGMRESDALKTTIIRSVSHDFRTPLTAIIAAGESSASPKLDQSVRREVASVIVTEATRLAETLGKLLDMSRLEGRAATPHMDWCSLEEVIDTALEHTPAAERFAVVPETPVPQVWADAAQLEQAFANLFENASRFGGPHPVRVSLEAGDTRVVVRVSDRGPGLDPDEYERVFEPFYRGNSELSMHRGPGLGLAIAKGFVETNGGRMWVEPGVEAGTTFVVELPLRKG